METKIQRWGNSLGLRIPKSFAEEASVEAGSIVDISVEGGDLVVRPIRTRDYDLGELVRAITRNNVHEPVETGPPVGREVW
ncbi:MAG: AbrB/MazE/SpoVT family DNA-binding domain-containing protein [Actinomycetota bacterium]